jgi:hypothetical protein
MRSGIIALSGANESILIAWKRDGQLGWQQYDANGKTIGSPGIALSDGKGAAGIVDANGDFVLFR